MKGIRLLFEEDKDQPWLVYVNPTVFGKRRRKRFKTKAEANQQVKIYENRVINKERTPLDPELHKLVAHVLRSFFSKVISKPDRYRWCKAL